MHLRRSPSIVFVTIVLFLFCLQAGSFNSLHAAPPSSDSYSLIFADEFGGSTLDTYKWNYGYPWNSTYVHNHDAACYPANVTESDGVLNLTAKKQTTTVTGTTYYFTSGAINTSGKLNISSGYLEASIKMPGNMTGVWPAFWMLGSGWPPEIDIMEDKAGENWNYYSIYHYTDSSNKEQAYTQHNSVGSNLSSDYHRFGLDWTSSYMKFYFDGSLMYTVTDTSAIADAVNMYLLLNLAVGGAWGGDPWSATYPNSMKIDWVRVWQKTSSTGEGTRIWKGASGTCTWGSTSNWVGGTVPSCSTEYAFFDSVSGSSVTVNWSNSLTTGGISLGGTTAYTLGTGNESLMLAQINDTSVANPYSSGTAYISLSGSQSHTIKSRLDLYSHLAIQSTSTGTLTLAGGITGPAGFRLLSGNVRITGDSTFRSNSFINGGSLTLDAGGSFGASVLLTRVGSVTDSVTKLIVGARGEMDASTLELAYTSGSQVEMLQTSGTVYAATSIVVGSFGTANYTLTGGIATCSSMIIGLNEGAVGSVTINADATLTASSVAGSSGVSTFNFNGGTVKAAATASAFLDKLTYANIQAGGAIFDTNGYDVGIAQALIDAPSVHGSLTKQGAGTLTLSGSNTYSGTTYVNAGALSLAPTTAHNLSAVVNNAAFEIAHGSVTVDSVTGAGSTYVADGILVVGTLVQDSLFLGQAAPESATAATEAVPEPVAWLTFAFAAALFAAIRRRSLL